MLEPKKFHRRQWNMRLGWDWFMVWVAIMNLSLILFEFTYLPLRPFYLRNLPAVTKLYDPVR